MTRIRALLRLEERASGISSRWAFHIPKARIGGEIVRAPSKSRQLENVIAVPSHRVRSLLLYRQNRTGVCSRQTTSPELPLPPFATSTIYGNVFRCSVVKRPTSIVYD